MSFVDLTFNGKNDSAGNALTSFPESFVLYAKMWVKRKDYNKSVNHIKSNTSIYQCPILVGPFTEFYKSCIQGEEGVQNNST